MALRLPRLPDVQPAWSSFKLWWQRMAEAIEKNEKNQDDTIDRIRRLLSHTTPTTILSATNSGGSVTLSLLDHTRVYADGTTVFISGIPPQTGFLNDTWYGCYYDDPTLSLTTPTVIFTTNINTSQSTESNGRHFCGLIRTPPAGSVVVIESGGSYPAGAAAVGGELN